MSSRSNLILIGAGGHARACIDAIEQHAQFQVVGLIGMPNELNTSSFGYAVIATDDQLPKLAQSYRYALVTVGQIKTPDGRIRLFEQAVSLGFVMPSIIAPTAYVSRHSTIGGGTIVMQGSIVNAGAKIGRNCIINTGAIIEHDVTVGDHCHISTSVILNGGVTVGVGSFLGSGTIVKEGVSIGERCVVGMGIAMRHNLNDRTQLASGTK